jgi:hypothetical protein
MMFREFSRTTALHSLETAASNLGPNVLCWQIARVLCRLFGVDRASTLADQIVKHVQIFTRNGGFK